jgi:hypothetical protein
MAYEAHPLRKGDATQVVPQSFMGQHGQHGQQEKQMMLCFHPDGGIDMMSTETNMHM